MQLILSPKKLTNLFQSTMQLCINASVSHALKHVQPPHHGNKNNVAYDIRPTIFIYLNIFFLSPECFILKL